MGTIHKHSTQSRNLDIMTNKNWACIKMYKNIKRYQRYKKYKMKVVNITEVMIKLQFKLPQALINRGFTRRTVFEQLSVRQNL